MKTLKIFVSSPRDVRAERAVAHRVIGRLALEYAYHFKIEPVMSELEPMVATDTPQGSITPPSATDIVLVLLWSRLGTPLPNDPRFKTSEPGRQPTGTEWEFYDAIRSHQAKGVPDVVVYRKTERVSAILDDRSRVMEALHQQEELKRFLDQWFRESDGTWKAWFHSFSQEAELEHLLDTHLRKLIGARIEADPRTEDAPTGKAIEGNPFRGLSPFDIKDAPLFFGRTAALSELRDVLETQNALRRGFVIVTGGSGSGKSSLVRAGLLADLQNPNRVGRVAVCRYAVMRPSDREGQILLGIANAILADTAFPELRLVEWSEADLARLAAEDPQRVIEAIRHAAGIAAKGARLRDASDVRLCLVIDQFEEIFTAGIQKSELAAFTRLVSLMARSELVWIIATLRSDFYHRLDEVPDILLLAERGYYRLKPPLPTEIGEMIHKPAQLAGLRFERHRETGQSLDAVLQDDAISDPTALPLLEFALHELWTQRTASGLLTFSAYERMGRMTGAIAERAEGLLADLSPQAQDNIAPLLRALVTVSHHDAEPTAATVRRSLIAATAERSEVLDRLIAARLVVTDDLENRGDPKCRLAHERLIQTWPRLKKLAEADRSFLEARDRLRAEAEGWVLKQRAPDLLLPAGSRLAEGEQYLRARRDELDGYTIEFAEASVAADHAKRTQELRRSHRVAIGFAGLAAVVFALLVVTWLKQREAWLAAGQANRGFGLAINAARTLSAGAGTSGTNIESVMDQVDGMLKDVAAASNTDPAIVEQRARLLLSFADASERLGNFDQQSEWIKTARQVLRPLCQQSTTPSCQELLASSYEGEGNHEMNVGKAEQAVAAYKEALARYPLSESVGIRVQLARVRTQAKLAQAFVSLGKTDDALSAASDCDGMAAKLPGNDPLVQFTKADCALAKSASFHKADKEAESLRAADTALALNTSIKDRSALDIQSSEQVARIHRQLAFAQWPQQLRQEAVANLEQAATILEPVVRNNPQNDQVASLLATVLDTQSQEYTQMERDDLAAPALERAVELARAQQNNPRKAFWSSYETQWLKSLRQRYEVLERWRDAMKVAKALLQRQIEGMENKDAPLPIDAERTLLSAGHYALKISDGAAAADNLSKALDHAQRQLAVARAKGHDPANEYSPFSTIAYYAVILMSEISGKMLPEEKRLPVLEALAARISRFATDDPHVIPFRMAEGQILYEWASALEQAGDLERARQAHERASNAGWRVSTIVLRRWYMEGLAGVRQDQKQAMRLEARAAGQSELPTWDIEVSDRDTKEVSRATLWFKEPGGAADPMADELYRLRRYFNKDVTEKGRKVIQQIYDAVAKYHASVANVLHSVQRNQSESGALPWTDISNAARAVRDLLKAGKPADTVDQVLKIRAGLSGRPNAEDRANLLAWGVLADVADEARRDQNVAKDAVLAQTLASIRDQAVDIILRMTAEGSSPRLALADDLEQVADRMRATERFDLAVRLYDRAIEFRSLVRARDPANARCQCAIAHVLHAIAVIEKQRNNLDAAMEADQKSLMIYEDLNWLEPERGWRANAAFIASELARVAGQRNEARSALFYAQEAAGIYKELADRNSADSQSRMTYAEALESVSEYARLVANEEKRQDAKGANSHFELAASNLQQANAIRESVLAVDPSNGECRCHVGHNYEALADIYQDWGRPDELIKMLANAVSVDREVLRKEPDQRQLRYNLGYALYLLGRAREHLKPANYAEAMKDFQESLDLLRPLAGTDFPSARDTMTSDLISVSFTALFVGDDSTALAAAEEGLRLNPDEAHSLTLQTNKAHALMFLGRTEEARPLYLANRGKPLGSSTWDRTIADDFEALRKQGRTNPLMDEVLQAFQEAKLSG